MDLLLVAALVVGVVVLTPVADRWRIPQPILLLVYGLVLALVPQLPELQLDANLVLPVVLPPLLFAATQRTTVRQFRDAAAPILLLAVGLTVATAAVVAVVAHAVGLPWTAAAVLGAIVSPPDPVAATAVARRLRLPERIVTILEGEGMFNDATALVLYKVAVAAAVTGEFSAAATAAELVLAVLVGVGLGLVLGWLTKVALSAVHDGAAETTLTLVAPFVAYLAAEHLRGSGVLAVLTLGLYLRHRGHSALTAGGWLLGRSVWDFADFLITSVLFVLLGFELTTVIEHTSTDVATLGLATLVVLVVVLFRAVWMFPAVALARSVAHRRQTAVPFGWRETAVVSWAGMRGVVTVATALALPSSGQQGELWWRSEVVVAGLGCVLVTLVVQGLTLSPLIRLLGVGSEGDDRGEVLQLRRRAIEAALARLRSEENADDVAVRTVIKTYQGRLDAQLALFDAMGRDGEGRGSVDPERSAELDRRLREVFRQASDVERDVVLTERADGRVSPAVADEVLVDVEARAARGGS